MKLLTVEDDMSLQKGLCKGFCKLGYKTDAASNGDEALGLFYSNNYRLIVLDLNLPKLQGLDVLRRIRAENTYNIF